MSTRLEIEAKVVAEIRRESGSIPRWMLNRRCRSRRWSAMDYESILESMKASGKVGMSTIGNIPIVSLASTRPREPDIS